MWEIDGWKPVPRPKGRGKEIREWATIFHVSQIPVFNSPALLGLRITHIFISLSDRDVFGRGGSHFVKGLGMELVTRPCPPNGYGFRG
jgi:hypothetical protein